MQMFSLDLNENAISQERMQMFCGSIQTQMFWLHVWKCILISFRFVVFILTFCFMWKKQCIQTH